MAKIRFKHNNHDTIKKLFVKKKTFKLLVVLQLITFVLLGWFSYKLANYGYFRSLYSNLKSLIISTL